MQHSWFWGEGTDNNTPHHQLLRPNNDNKTQVNISVNSSTSCLNKPLPCILLRTYRITKIIDMDDFFTLFLPFTLNNPVSSPDILVFFKVTTVSISCPAPSDWVTFLHPVASQPSIMIWMLVDVLIAKWDKSLGSLTHRKSAGGIRLPLAEYLALILLPFCPLCVTPFKAPISIWNNQNDLQASSLYAENGKLPSPGC